MAKRMRTTCNICFETQTDIKCNYCRFECCYQCIHQWSERSRYCPQCRKFETYDIEYSLIEEEKYLEFHDLDLFVNDEESSISTYEINSEYDEHEYDEHEYNQNLDPLIFDFNFSDNEELNDEHPNYNYFLPFDLLPPSPPPYPPPPSPAS